MLELKHLAPYLPYKLQLMQLVGGIDTECCLTALNINTHVERQSKPILRPLSDFEKFKNDFDLSTDFDSCYYHNSEDIACVNTGNSTYLSDMLTVTSFVFKHHFDVFNLIEQGLAIDVNTITHE